MRGNGARTAWRTLRNCTACVVGAAIAFGWGAAGPARAEGSGRLFFVNAGNGTYMSGGLDQNGDWAFKETSSYSSLTGVTNLVATPSFMLAYRAGGGGETFLIDGRGSTVIAQATSFSADWNIIKGFGNYLFFYGINSAQVGAVVRANPDGTVTQTWSNNGLSKWTNIESTDNYLFFYNGANGTTALGTIGWNGAFYQSGTKTSPVLSAGYNLTASVGDAVLLYNYNTGAWESGPILYTGSAGQDGYTTRIKEVATSGNTKLLAKGYNESVSNDGHLMLYNSATGAAVIGHFDVYGAYTVDHTLTLAKYYTSLVSCGQFVFFYGFGTGQAQTGYFTADGNFQPRQTFGNFGASWLPVASTRN